MISYERIIFQVLPRLIQLLPLRFRTVFYILRNEGWYEENVWNFKSPSNFTYYSPNERSITISHWYEMRVTFYYRAIGKFNETYRRKILLYSKTLKYRIILYIKKDMKCISLIRIWIPYKKKLSEDISRQKSKTNALWIYIGII